MKALSDRTCAHKELAAVSGALEGFALRIGLFALLWTTLWLRTLDTGTPGNKIRMKLVTKVCEISEFGNYKTVLVY